MYKRQSEYTLDHLRSRIGMVLQKNELFSGSIAQNLRWGNPGATDEDLRTACRAAQADDFIRSFPRQYETELGRGGVNVSGGQKQRLCVAMALLKKPAILILDDSTSAIDTATESRLRQALRTQLTDTTVIIIAQRISSIQTADRIVVLDDGAIIATGTHTTLMATSPAYQDIYYSCLLYTSRCV